MSTLLLVALTSFAGLEGRILEGETFETTESRTKELVRLKLAKHAVADEAGEPEGEADAAADLEKEEKEPRKTKEDKTPTKTK